MIIRMRAKVWYLLAVPVIWVWVRWENAFTTWLYAEVAGRAWHWEDVLIDEGK